jgi:queuine tRNA-ribosyltransferase
MALEFSIDHRLDEARAGRLLTPHGVVETPVFMPVGTLGSVKSVPQDVLEELGVHILLGNTYHLYLRPGIELVRSLGGLHRFMSWNRAILTDSGGYQVFSLSALRKISEEGVSFRSHLDGSSCFLGPETAIAAQIGLGADIIMAFDECTEHPASRERARDSMQLTLRWAERSKRYFEEHKQEAPWYSRSGTGNGAGESAAGGRSFSNKSQALFGIVQGGMHLDLRRESAERTVQMGFDGYAIGGLSVGEPRHATAEAVAATMPHLPWERPRYLMGVGTPEELVYYAARGVDMMDCVLPTRAARHGLLYTSAGRLSIKNTRYARDESPLDARCGCSVCRRYSRAYLRHLYASREVLAMTLNTIHNLAHYLDTMKAVRHSIKLGKWATSLSEYRSTLKSGHSPVP